MLSRFVPKLTSKFAIPMLSPFTVASKYFRGLSTFSSGSHLRYLSSTSTQDPITKGIEKPKANTKQLGTEALEILKYCQFIYLDSVPYELLQKIVPDQAQLDKALRELINSNTLIKMHDQLYFYRETPLTPKLEQADRTKVLSNLLRYITELFPLLQSYNIAELARASRLRDCAKVIANKAKNEISGGSSDIALLHYMLGNYYRHILALPDATLCYTASLEMRKRLHPGNHISVVKALNDLGTAHLLFGGVVIYQSLGYFNQAYDMLTHISPADETEMARTLNNIGAAYAQIKEKEKLEAAIGYFKNALDIRQKVLPENHVDIATTLSNIGSAYTDLGGATNCNISIVYHENAIKILKGLYPALSNDLAHALYNFAVAYSKLGDNSKALEYFKQTYCILQVNLGEIHCETMQARRGIESIQPDFFKAGGFVQKLQEFDTSNVLKVGAERRKIILSHGSTTGVLVSLKQRIQTTILDKVETVSRDGYEARSWRGYYDVWTFLNVSLKPELEKLGTDSATLRETQMLCFEAMNLGIMRSPVKPYKMVESFCRTNTDLVKEIALKHPEFFVDGSIVEACIKAIPHDREFGDLLRENVKYADSEVKLIKTEELYR